MTDREEGTMLDPKPCFSEAAPDHNLRTFGLSLKWPFGHLRMHISNSYLDLACQEAEGVTVRSICEAAITAIVAALAPDNANKSTTAQHQEAAS
jgi:hypothetical protein